MTARHHDHAGDNAWVRRARHATPESTVTPLADPTSFFSKLPRPRRLRPLPATV